MKIRIGNTIDLSISLKSSGNPYPLAGKDITVIMSNIAGETVLEGFEISGNTIRYTYQGSAQRVLGPYTFTVIENRGLDDQHALDICNAFELVPCSHLAGGSSEVATVSIDLEGEFSLIRQGESEMFVAHIETTTFDDVKEAMNEGKTVLLNLYGEVMYLSGKVLSDEEVVAFEFTNANSFATLRNIRLDRIDGWMDSELKPLVVDDGTVLRQDDIANNVTTTEAGKALDARQGKVLNDRINNLQSIGRFLALWDCTTGLPETNPSGYPYEYHTGDYFRVSQVGATNYKPDGASYEGTASTTVTTEDVQVGDIWFYDGTSWNLQVNHIGGVVQDVKVDGVSVVSGGVANIADKVFVAEYGVTTFAAAKAAYDAGKVVFVYTGGYIYKAYQASSAAVFFYSLYGNGQIPDTFRTIRVNSSGWGGINNGTLQFKKLVTSLGPDATDEQYPSAKCVYDQVGGLKFAAASALPATPDANTIYFITE